MRKAERKGHKANDATASKSVTESNPDDGLRHGDGKSWWLLKQAADTNLVYKFLFTEDKIYGPYIQGFSSPAAPFQALDYDGQVAFSKDGTKYVSTSQGYGMYSWRILTVAPECFPTPGTIKCLHR
jgi:hypothetical protein